MNCHECNRYIWFYQKEVSSLDGVWRAHKQCRQEGFHNPEATEQRKNREDLMFWNQFKDHAELRGFNSVFDYISSLEKTSEV